MVAQNPYFASMGIFVVAMATLISMTNGMAATRVRNPTMTNNPHNFDHAHEGSEKMRRWNADFRKTSNTQYGGEKKLLHAF